MKKYDLLISGDGLTAKATALLAARAGLSNLRLAVEATHTSYADDPRSYAIANKNLHALAKVGAKPSALPVQGMVLQFGDRFDKTATRINRNAPLMHMVDHTDLVTSLDRALAAAKGAELATAGDIYPNLGEFMVSIDGLATAPLFVIAEGSQTTTAKRLGFAYKRHSYNQSAIVAKLETNIPNGGFARQLFTQHGPIGILPATTNSVSVVWSVDDNRAAAIMDQDDAGFIATLEQHIGSETGPLRLLTKPSKFPLRDTHATRLARGRAIVLGDAAHVVHPMAGQGLNLGLRDARALIEILADARALGQDIGTENVTNAYANNRRPDIDRLAFLTRSLDQLRKTPFMGLINHALPTLANARLSDEIIAITDS